MGDNLVKRLRIVLRQTDPRNAVIEADMILAEWQSMEHGQEAGHTDKIFNNWGSGRADRVTPETHPWAAYAKAMEEMIARWDL